MLALLPETMVERQNIGRIDTLGWIEDKSPLKPPPPADDLRRQRRAEAGDGKYPVFVNVRGGFYSERSQGGAARRPDLWYTTLLKLTPRARVRAAEEVVNGFGGA